MLKWWVLFWYNFFVFKAKRHISSEQATTHYIKKLGKIYRLSDTKTLRSKEM